MVLALPPEGSPVTAAAPASGAGGRGQNHVAAPLRPGSRAPGLRGRAPGMARVRLLAAAAAGFAVMLVCGASGGCSTVTPGAGQDGRCSAGRRTGGSAASEPQTAAGQDELAGDPGRART